MEKLLLNFISELPYIKNARGFHCDNSIYRVIGLPYVAFIRFSHIFLLVLVSSEFLSGVDAEFCPRLFLYLLR
jgi:hypothetical protein